jgi:hypothetical protein
MWRPILLACALLGGALPASAQTPPGPAPSAPPAETAPPAPAAPAPPEALQSFDWTRAELQWNGKRWQVVAGGVVLKDFGARQEEACAALRLVRQLRLTQHGAVGTPRPVMEYWLADGRAPQGLVTGLHPIPLDPATLRVELVQGQWCVRDNTRVLFTFGPHADDANQALAVIRRYGFTQVGFLGRGVPDMLVFLGSTAPTAATGADRPAPTPFSRVVPPAHPPGQAVRQAGFSAGQPDGGVVTAGLKQPASGDGVGPSPLPFGRQPGAADPAVGGRPPETDRVPFNWRQAEVRQEGNDWKLVAGNSTLANFGPHDTDARLALNVVRFYHVTEQGVIGGPRPLFNYFLCNGQAPHGYMLGVENMPFHPDALTVRQAGDSWLIYDGGRALLNFGDRPDDARRALDVIRHYQFDTLCRVGHADTGGLTFFIRAR